MSNSDFARMIDDQPDFAIEDEGGAFLPTYQEVKKLVAIEESDNGTAS